MGSAEPQIVTMRAFIIVALVSSVYGEAKPYTVGQVLTGATNGGVITSTTYHGGLKVAGFPHAAVVPALGLILLYLHYHHPHPYHPHHHKPRDPHPHHHPHHRHPHHPRRHQ